MSETQKEREAREQAEEKRRFAEAQNVEILKSRITSYKARIHNVSGEKALLTRQAAEVIEKAKKEASEKLAMADAIEGNVPKLRTLLARAENELRVLTGQRNKNVIAATSILGL